MVSAKRRGRSSPSVRFSHHSKQTTVVVVAGTGQLIYSIPPSHFLYLIPPPRIRTIPRNLPRNLLGKPLGRLGTQPRRLGRGQDGLDPHADLVRIAILPHAVQHLVDVGGRLEGAGRAQHGGHLARVLHGGHADLAVKGRGDVELLQDGELRGGGQDEQAVALGRRGLEQGEEGLDDAVGEAQADGVPFDQALDVVWTGLLVRERWVGMDGGSGTYRG